MPATTNNIQLLAGNNGYERMPCLNPLPLFDNTVVGFLSELSAQLIKHPQARQFPDIMTFGFFIRSANLKKHATAYAYLDSSIGRGVSFHIAPSNVPINFAYSLAAGLLSGNACIVRVSSKHFPQTDIVCAAISSVLEQSEYSELKQNISIVRYERDQEINSYFSTLCDIRIIWGGDSTISELRNAKLQPRAFDITFADRYSFCIINAEKYLALQDKDRIATNFYNDTYLFDQNACSSPRLIYWVGDNTHVTQAKNVFWSLLHKTLLEKQYSLKAMTVINKFTTACQAALDYDSVKIPHAIDNSINRIELKTLPSDLPEHSCGGGCFFEYADPETQCLSGFVSRKFQTMTYIGFTGTELQRLFLDNRYSGIDRIVPCGSAGDFSFRWDGYDLISHMSRTVTVA